MKRTLFLSGTAALVAVPSGLRAQSPAPAKLRIAASAVGDIVIVLWAVQSGIFQKYGLDVDLQRMNSSASITAAVIGGSLDLGKASLFGLIVARSKGLPIILEAPSALYTSTAPDAALVVAKNSPIQNAKDLNGKLLASASLGDLFSTVNAAWVDQNGGDSKTLKYVELPGTATADAIVAGRVDAGTLADPILSEAVRSGKCRILGYPEEVIGKQSVATAYFTTADFAAKNGAALARFRKACDESVAYVKAHQAEMIPLVAKFSGIDPKNVSVPSLGRAADLLDTRLTQPTIDIAAKYKAIAKPFAVKEMIDPSAFPA
jgi:NitT/TauT family transport system substrate-binding protein